eukprot:m.195057 g.195057  ORF g.195057 m.195057 type:complete len:567 (+) comp18676_c0_seq1:442-2142(+)
MMQDNAHADRWTTLKWWWATHAFGNGVGRIVFDVSIPYLLSSKDATSALSMGTMATLIGKFLSGPVCGFLGTKLVGWLSLVLLAGISLSVALVEESSIVQTFLVAIVTSRFVMCFTWPATNQMLRAWFPVAEHGQAWGIMATSSRTGIIVTTILLRTLQVDLPLRSHFFTAAVVMATAAAVFAAVFQETPAIDIDGKSNATVSDAAGGGDVSDGADSDIDIAALARDAMANVDRNAIEMDEEIDSDDCGDETPDVGLDDVKTIAAAARAALAKVDAVHVDHDEDVDSDEAFDDDDETKYGKHFPTTSANLRQRKINTTTQRSVDNGTSSTRTPAATTPEALSAGCGVLHHLWHEVRNPIIWGACMVQMTATPIAEFQSQVPIMLQSDPYFTPSMVSGYTMVWHLGVLAGALCGGRLIDLDSENMRWRLCVVGGPMLLAVLLLQVMATEGTGPDSRLFSGINKVPAIFLLAALHSPAQYLVMGTTVSRHTHQTTSATVASVIDMMGYVGSFLLLWVASLSPDVRHQSPGLSEGLLKTTQLFALVCTAAVAIVYTLEHHREARKEKTT